MTIVAEEYFRGRRGDAYSSRERDYLVTGTGGDADLDENNAILAATAVSPASLTSTDGILVRTNASIGRVIANNQMIVSVQYGEAGGHLVLPTPIGTVEYEFNYQAQSEPVKFSLETISVTSKTGPEDVRMFGGQIGVSRNSDGTFDIEGVNTAAGSTTNVWTFTTVAGTLASNFEQLVEGMMGGVNATPFRGRAIGTTRLVTCTSQFSTGSNPTAGGKLQIRFGFQYIAGATNIRIGDITVPSKDGHDLLWVHSDLKDISTFIPTAKLVLPWPKYAVVERVFPRVNFSLLGF